MTGRNWTELFFLDEATAFAAGHRPCGYCRRAAYNAYVSAWTNATGNRPSAKEMDRILHPARVTRDRHQIHHDAPLNMLPDGTFVLIKEDPHLVWQGRTLPYSPDGYGPPKPKDPHTNVVVLTPKPTVAVLAAGHVPQVAV